MSERKHLRLEYSLRPDVDVEGYLPKLNEFVANMRAHDPSHDYASYRDTKDARHFVHVGHLDAEVAGRLQEQAWFKTFTTYLRTITVEPPNIAMLALVASTR